MGRRRKAAGDPKVYAYARVSTTEQADSGLGLAAQREALATEVAKRPNHLPDLVVWVTDEGVSGSVAPEDRPALGPVMLELKAGDTLAVSCLERLGRCTSDVLRLADAAAAGGWHLVALDLQLDTATPVGRFVLTTLAAVATLERDLIASRTREALQAKKARGARLGRPVSLPDEVRRRVVEQRAAGASYREIADRLTREGIATGQGGQWHPSTVQRVCRSVGLDREAAQARAAAVGSPASVPA